VTLGAAKLWGVSSAAGFNRDQALAMYSRAMQRLSAVIGDQDPSLLSSRLRTRGTNLVLSGGGSAPTPVRRQTIFATASAAPAGPVLC